MDKNWGKLMKKSKRITKLKEKWIKRGIKWRIGKKNRIEIWGDKS